MVDKQKIGGFIAALRKEKNLTQAELAERLNVSNKSISRWENGQTLPDYDQVLDLCAILGIGAADFLNGEYQSSETERIARAAEPEQKEKRGGVKEHAAEHLLQTLRQKGRGGALRRKARHEEPEDDHRNDY